MKTPWLVAAGLALAGCGLPEGEYFGRVPEPDPTHLRYCNSGEPEYLDPALASSTTDMKPIYAMFDGLTDFDPDGLPMPSVATRWDIAPDQRTFTFHLRDDARWSSGRPLVAGDFAYHIARVLHPRTGSKNASTHWRLKNGELYTANRVRLVLRDGGGLAAGDVVELVGLGGEVAPDPAGAGLPDSNLRSSSGELALRDLGAADAQAYARVPPGHQVLIVELGGTAAGARDWAYVYWDEDDGVYGWVPLAELDGQPHGEVVYTVRPVGPEHTVGVTLPAAAGPPRPTTTARGVDLLMLPDVLGVRAPDDRTLVLETHGPVPFMIDQSPQRAFRATPREAVSRWPKRWVYPEHIITSGPFHLTAWKMRDYLRFDKAATFWGAAEVRLERLTMFAINDQAANANLYLQGSCDAMTSNNIPASYLPVMARRGYKDFTIDPYLGIYLYLINAKKFPNVHLRRALSYAIDRTPLPNITRGMELPTAQYMPGKPIHLLDDDELALCGVSREDRGVAAIVEAGALCYVPPPGLDYDLVKMKEELAIARREMGASFPRRITIKFNTGVEQHKLIAEWMQQQLSHKLGIVVELESQEWKTFLKDTVTGQYDVARFGWIGGFPDPEAEFLNIFKCDSPDNRTGWCSAEFDRLMKEADGVVDRKARLALIREAERVMIEDAPVVPLYVYTQKNLRRPYVRGLDLNLVDQPSFRRVWIDPDWRAAAGAR
jgi:oligopeptide transport system substrate-binding protein